MKKSISICMLILLMMGTGAAAADKTPLTLMLDWFPNVDHLPIYVAKHRGWFADRGIALDIVSPSETADALKLAAAGKVDLAVSYEPQTIIAAAQGLSVMAVGRLIEHPLTTLLFLKNGEIEEPDDLSGRTIGYTVPGLMDLLLDAFAKINHIENYQPVNVGFAILQSLTAGKVSAVMGPFKTYETVTLSAHGFTPGFFALENYGIPDYDELVFICGKSVLARKEKALADFVSTVQRAIDETRRRPEQALADYLEEVPDADRHTETDAFHLTLPFFAHSQTLEEKRWQKFADFALRYKLIEKSLDAGQIIENVIPAGK